MEKVVSKQVVCGLLTHMFNHWRGLKRFSLPSVPHTPSTCSCIQSLDV